MSKSSSAGDSTALVLEPAGTTRIRGRIDAIDGGMIFGWAYDEAHPEDRVEVRILHGETEIGRVTADRPRADLQRLGVGQGTHAFACALPEGISPELSGLKAIAVSPRSGLEMSLERPLRLDISDDAVAAQLGRIADLLEASLARQDDIRSMQHAMAGALRTIHGLQRQQTADDGKEDVQVALNRALTTVEESQQALSERLTQMDVFQLRFDETLRLFEKRLQALTTSADQPLRRAVAALAVFTGIIAGVAIYAVAMPRI